MKLIIAILFPFLFSFSNQYLEKGEIEKVIKNFLKGKYTSQDIKVIKAYFENFKEEPEEYLRLYAKGLYLEKTGNKKEALNYYLKSIQIKPDYNPSYYRFNFLIRSVDNPEAYRKKLVEILKKRFTKTPPVIVENSENKYVFLVEKMSQYLYVFKGKKLVGMYPVTTGKKLGNKMREGDQKTPEGIYYFVKRISPERLPKIYGGIAVVLNYPNPYDKLLGKTGSGIWLHGSDTEDKNKIPFSTRGCVVAENTALRKEILPKIRINNTLIGIYKVIPSDLEVGKIKEFIYDWKNAWENKDFEKYISLYSKKFRWKGGGFKEWKKYKKRVILSKKFIKIKISELTILAYREGLEKEPRYYVAEFLQEYTSDKYSDKGIKRLYIVKESADFKIISEEFLGGS